jgi:heat shock protein HslJ
MKTQLFIWFSLIIFGFVSCDKSEDDFNIESIADTQWKLTRITDKSGVTSDFPSGIDDFEIVFQENGKIKLFNLCNYSYADYKLTDLDSIGIFSLGQGTMRYCLPNVRMDWESLFINNLVQSETFSISKNRLTINCRDSKLTFGFISKN